MKLKNSPARKLARQIAARERCSVGFVDPSRVEMIQARAIRTKKRRSGRVA